MKRHSKSWILKHTLEVATVILAVATIWLAVETRLAATRSISVSTWLEMEKRFDSPEMKQSRAALAMQFDHYDPAKFDDSKLDVLDLFDDMGALYENGLIDKKLTRSSFSWYVNNWWEASKNYIANERKTNNDYSEYNEFEKLAARMHPEDPNITTNDLKDFLAAEERIGDRRVH